MENLFLRVLTLSLTASLVLLPLLALAPRLHHRYAGRTFYVLWLVLAVRLVLPVPLTLPNPAVTVDLPPARTVTLSGAVQAPAAVTAPAGAEGAEAPAAVGPAQPVSAETPRRPGVGWTQLGAWLWLGGMASLLVYQGAGYALARRKLLRGAEPGSEEETALLAALAAGLGVRRAPPLLRTVDAASPMVLGLARPVLLLPEGQLPEEALEVVLRHELTHLKRHDVAYQALLLLARTVHWFNPLVWWMGREAGRSLELCCDDAVVRGRDEAFCRRYGSVLLRTATGGRMPLSTQFGGGKGQLKARLGNLFRKKRNSAALVCIALACALLCTSLVACEQAELTPEEALDALEDSIAVEGDRISFTVPERCGPEEDWEITISGWGKDGADSPEAIAFLEDEDWQAGKTYGIGMTTEAWEAAAALTLEAYPPQAYGTGTYPAAQVGRTVDLLALWRAGNGLMTGQEALDAVERSVAYENGALTFTLPDGYSAGDWTIHIFGFKSGSKMVSYLEDTDWQGGKTYTIDFTPEQLREHTRLFMDIYLPAPEGTVDELGNELLGYSRTLDLRTAYRAATGQTAGHSEVYVNETYGFSLTLPESWTGHWQAEETDGVIVFSCTEIPVTEARGELFTLSVYPEQLEAVNSRTRLLGGKEGCWVYISYPQTNSYPDVAEEAVLLYLDMYDDGLTLSAGDFSLPEGAALVYTNDAWGLTLTLPGSWKEYGACQEGEDSVLFYCAALGPETGGVAQVRFLDKPLEALTGRDTLLGYRPGCYVYSYGYQAPLPALQQATQEVREQYDTLYSDLHEGLALTFENWPVSHLEY